VDLLGVHGARPLEAYGERFAGRLPEHLYREVDTVKKIIREVVFFTVAAAVIVPAPTLLWAYVTGKTISEVLYR
jgi:hypothetical protein